MGIFPVTQQCLLKIDFKNRSNWKIDELFLPIFKLKSIL